MNEENTLETQEETEPVEQQEETSNTEDTSTEETSKEEINEDNESEDIDYLSMSDEEFEKYLLGEQKQKEETKKEVINTQIEQDYKLQDKEVKETKETKVEQPTLSNDEYKTFYESVLKPFKANGKEVTPRNINDVIALMQMGANYTKKMQAIAPMKKAVESLNKAGIDEERLNFLIDVSKGNQEAIKTLLKEHKVDPIDLDLDSTNYVPSKNLATDKDIEFSDTLRDINESLPKIKEIMDTKWDEESKNELLTNPRLLQALHEEIQLGRFEAIQSILEREKMFGRYKGVPDIKAYSDIVTQIAVHEQQEYEKKQKDKVESSKNKENKAKAAPTKSKPKTNKGTSISAQDLLSLSDEEFDKLNLKDII